MNNLKWMNILLVNVSNTISRAIDDWSYEIKEKQRKRFANEFFWGVASVRTVGFDNFGSINY